MANRQNRAPQIVRLKDFPREAGALDEETKALFDPSCSDKANADHLRIVLMGYRNVIVWGRDADCPFHPGSVRSISWQQGAEMARKDLAHPCKVVS